MTAQTGTTPGSEEVADRMAIEQILYLCSRGLDRLDPDAIKQSYWPEAEVDYGAFKGGAHIFADLVIGALGEQYELTRHCLANTLIDLQGNQALSESCVNAGHLLKGAAEEMLFYGRYLDRLEKRDGAWKIMHRQVVMDWSKTVPVQDERESEAFAAMGKGAHLDTDPLYPFLNA